MASTGPVLGIDLGTTFSCVAVYWKGKLRVIDNDGGGYITPSCVHYSESEDEVLVGEEAVNMMPEEPENTLYDAKRLIGKQYNDKNIQEEIKMWSFNIVNNKENPVYEINKNDDKRQVRPEEVSAMILKKMKGIVERRLNMEDINNVVITVPAYFSEAQRKATWQAGHYAGLKVLRLINEPTAAALAFGFDNASERKINVLVYDLGGGTFDTSVLTMEEGIYEVKSYSGNTHLGGQDFTSELVKYCCKDIEKSLRKKVSDDKKAMIHLRRSCEKAKKQLSSIVKSTVILQYQEYKYKTTITRTNFESLNKSLFESTLTYVADALKEAKMSVSDIDEVVLVGGSTRIPKIREMLKAFFKNKELNSFLNPDEGVALGAAVQGGMTRGDYGGKSEIKLQDITPMSLGIEARLEGISGMMSTVVRRNSHIPLSCTNDYRTSEDNQSSVPFTIYAGEDQIAKNNIFLGKFIIDNLPPGPAESIKFDVTFKINENGILKVTAVERSKGLRNYIEIVNVTERISEAEREKMIKDIEKIKI